MTAVQKTYTGTLAPGTPGMIASEWPSAVDTKICDNDQGIGYGLAVCDSPMMDRGVVVGHLSGTASAAFVGISVRDITIAPDPCGGDGYQLGDNMSVMVQGDIWVIAKQAVTRGHKASFNATDGSLGTSGTAIPDSRWMTSAGAGQLAILRLTGPAPGV
jgi:hypothetical protein